MEFLNITVIWCMIALFLFCLILIFCMSVVANNINNTSGVHIDPALPYLVLFLTFLGNAPPPRTFRLQACEFSFKHVTYMEIDVYLTFK